MQKSKELFREVSIRAEAGGSKGLKSSTEARFSKHVDKCILPPIEFHWHLPPPIQQKSWFGKSGSFKAMLAHPTKWQNSIRLPRSPSMKAILDGVRDPKDEQIVESLRETLLLEGRLPDKHYDYHTLLRYLRMRDFDQTKAKEMFLNYLNWREEFGVEALIKEFQFEEYREVKECYPHGFHGVDRYGRPVYIDRLGLVDINRLLEKTTIDRFVKYHVCEQEKTLNWRYPACSLAAKKHIASTTSILDVKNVGTTNFSKPARYLFLEIQKIDSNYYPETLNRLFIINAGSGFKVLWTAIKTFLEPRTLAKIKVLGSNYLSTLTEAIDPSNLPTFLGGKCTCSDSGGCLFSDKGPWTDPDITNMLQSMIVSEEECQERLKRNLATEDGDDARQNDLSETRVGDHLSPKKIQAFEKLLIEAKRKIRTLEVALEDIKLVLQGLTQHMEELKR